jgi:superfamily II DNA or RNA helicase
MSRVYDLEYETYSYEDLDGWVDEETGSLAKRHGESIRNAMEGVGVVFMDECHRVAAPTAMKVMECLTNPRFRFGLSASPWRDDGADLAIQACLGPVAYSITASDLIDLGYLVPPIIRMVDVPPRSFARRTPYATIYKEYIVENEDRNNRIIAAAASLVRRGKPTLVLVQRIRHGEFLQREISERIGTWVPFLSGRDSAATRKSSLDDIREGRSGIFIASVIADEGLDLKPLSGLILAGGGKSSVKALQRIGRTLRPFKNKTGAEIWDFYDQALHLIHHSAARIRLYETEPRWQVLDC